VSALGESYEQARKKVYSTVQSIEFERAYFRKDIGIK
jgi:phosphoribosylamine-glycine ligase